MLKTKYTIYWTYKGSIPNSVCLENLNDALKFTEDLRRDAKEKNFSFITMCSENVDHIGKLGAAGVEDGKLPTGEAYTYTKGDALSQRTKKPAVGADFIEVNLDDEFIHRRLL